MKPSTILALLVVALGVALVWIATRPKPKASAPDPVSSVAGAVGSIAKMVTQYWARPHGVVATPGSAYSPEFADDLSDAATPYRT